MEDFTRKSKMAGCSQALFDDVIRRFLNPFEFPNQV